MSTSQDLVSIIDSIKQAVESVLKSDKPWYGKIGAIAEAVVPKVEDISNQVSTVNKMSGADKKALAMEVINHVYFKYFDSKYIPNFLESIIVNKVTSFLIDKTVETLNRTGVFKHS